MTRSRGLFNKQERTDLIMNYTKYAPTPIEAIAASADMGRETIDYLVEVYKSVCAYSNGNTSAAIAYPAIFAAGICVGRRMEREEAEREGTT